MIKKEQKKKTQIPLWMFLFHFYTFSSFFTDVVRAHCQKIEILSSIFSLSLSPLHHTHTRFTRDYQPLMIILFFFILLQYYDLLMEKKIEGRKKKTVTYKKNNFIVIVYVLNKYANMNHNTSTYCPLNARIYRRYNYTLFLITIYVWCYTTHLKKSSTIRFISFKSFIYVN